MIIVFPRTSLPRLISQQTRSKKATSKLGGLMWLTLFIGLIASFGSLSGADRGGSVGQKEICSSQGMHCGSFGVDKYRWGNNDNGRNCV